MAHCRGLYPAAQVKRHSEINQTACPGEFFPFDEITRLGAGVAGGVRVVVRGKVISEARIINDRTFVPVRDIADALGATTAWDEATRTVTIS